MKRITALCTIAAMLITALTACTKSDADNEQINERAKEEIITIVETGVITEAGVYELSGEIDSPIVIDVEDGGAVRLVLNGVTLHSKDGSAIHAKGKVNVEIELADGTVNTLTDGGDSKAAIRVKSDLTIYGNGTLNVTAVNDGIRADNLTITGGDFTILTGGGVEASPPREGGLAGKMPGGFGGDRMPGGFGRENPPAEQEDDSVSQKGLKAENLIDISGGVFNINSADDGIHSDGDVRISGGSFVIKTGDDGIHADFDVLISGGEIDIPVCYEGIEGLTVTVSGGNIKIYANDDGINASDGSSENTGEMGGMPRPGFVANDDVFFRITGGTVEVHGSDGIDSNGHIFIEGGTLKLSGPSQSMEAALECDGVVTITGGEVITAGYLQTVENTTAQPVIRVSYRSQVEAASVIKMRDSHGNTLLQYTSTIACTVSGFTHPEFKIGETYSLYINGEKWVDVTITDNITSIGDDGGAFTADNGGMPGGGGRGGRPNGDWGEMFPDGMPDWGDMPSRGDRGNMPPRGEIPGWQ